MSIDKSVSHHVVKLLAWLWALSAPPEPLAISLVEGSPENWDFCISEPLELICNCINVSNCSLVLLCAWSNCLPNIEPGVLCIEGALPQIGVHWGKPMPMELYDTLTARVPVIVNGSLDSAIVPG